MAFSNLSNVGIFSNIKIAVVNNEAYRKNVSFMAAISTVSSSNTKDQLFDVTYATQEEAEYLLEENEIAGYIYFNPELHLVVKSSGINQTIIKSFLDDYQQTYATVMHFVTENQEGLEDISFGERNDYIQEVPIGKTEPNTIVIYFYTLIAMACLFGSFWGLNEVTSIQADLSPQGARVSVAPTHKLTLFLSSVSAAVTIQFGIILILLGYLKFILNIDFGDQIPYILLTCLVGTLAGVTFGSMIAAVFKKNEGLKVAILIIFTNLMSFLAGMMYDKMKYIIHQNVPILGYLNPVNLISDAFYALYYYNTYDPFYRNIFLLLGFSSVFSFITYTILRRQKYGSL
jgi:ABC-2 type transport system permease protein